jgi:hypothetical protein
VKFLFARHKLGVLILAAFFGMAALGSGDATAQLLMIAISSI